MLLSRRLELTPVGRLFASLLPALRRKLRFWSSPWGWFFSGRFTFSGRKDCRQASPLFLWCYHWRFPGHAAIARALKHGNVCHELRRTLSSTRLRLGDTCNCMLGERLWNVAACERSGGRPRSEKLSLARKIFILWVTPPFVKNCTLRSKADLEAVGSEVVAACDFGGLRRAANDSLRSGWCVSHFSGERCASSCWSRTRLRSRSALMARSR